MKGGFSLIECMVYVAGVALVSSLLFDVVYHAYTSSQCLYRSVVVQSAMSSALASMRRDIATSRFSDKEEVYWVVKKQTLLRVRQSHMSAILKGVDSCQVDYDTGVACIVLDMARSGRAMFYACERSRNIGG